jgi:hypothetical protein
MAMIPYDVDPSLHPAEPLPAQLDDGFSPPAGPEAGARTPAHAGGGQPAEPVLQPKSDF